ncbi:ATPase [Aminipila sp.]|jgi:vacuolar-type H+-ATPase subunit H|uniref:ATPase n=1 Tax=Aminipila sp. TaxID=2060095 RepID=UPI001D6551CF|nr:ATPase [Aminipila sp.]MBE6033946.1 ATPase [Clostridiales bacterium]
MKVLELLDEIEEIIDTSTSFPLTGKIMVDAEEILEIVKEIRVELPDEIQQAQWIKDERQRILEEARKEYETVINDAKRQAEVLIENDDIVVKSKMRADEIMRIAEENCKQLKLNTFDYIDSILFNFQDKMDQLNATYFADMFNKMENTFQSVNATLASNRSEIKDLAYKTQMDKDV